MQTAVLFGFPRARVHDGFEHEEIALEHLEIEAHAIDIDLVVEEETELACRHLPRKRR